MRGDRATERREREIARTRGDILRAAATAFARQGFDSTTMQAIAKEAGYTAPSLYSYFASKEEILQGLFALVLEQFRELYEQPIPAGLTFPQRLELLVGRQLDLVNDLRDAFAVFISMKPPCPLVTSTKGQASGFDVTLHRVRDWLRTHATKDDLGGHDFEEAALALIGIQHAFFRRWLGGGGAKRLSTHQAAILDLFLCGLCGTRDGNESAPPPSHRTRAGGSKNARARKGLGDQER